MNTVIEYAASKGVHMDRQTAKYHGLRISEHCRENGIKTERREDDVFGSINAYPLKALNQYFKEVDITKRCVAMPFGAYKGQLIEKVQIGYLQWFLENIDGHEEMKDHIRQHLQTPDMQAQILAIEEAREARLARAEARAQAKAARRRFNDFKDASHADMRTKTAWKEMGYTLNKGEQPQGFVVYGKEFDLYHLSQVTGKEMTEDETERLKAIQILDEMSWHDAERLLSGQST